MKRNKILSTLHHNDRHLIQILYTITRMSESKKNNIINIIIVRIHYIIILQVYIYIIL